MKQHIDSASQVRNKEAWGKRELKWKAAGVLDSDDVSMKFQRVTTFSCRMVGISPIVALKDYVLFLITMVMGTGSVERVFSFAKYQVHRYRPATLSG